ncbi:Cecropin-A [Eumeta japonica]|uniref:Cecropin-A n=1 Tax=Eumeta variegata TaxID=151549 RepID=A0A4C1VAG0_EUMVA|nr:Cecropin-A [Eumeta japonica]
MKRLAPAASRSATPAHWVNGERTCSLPLVRGSERVARPNVMVHGLGHLCHVRYRGVLRKRRVVMIRVQGERRRIDAGRLLTRKRTSRNLYYECVRAFTGRCVGGAVAIKLCGPRCTATGIECGGSMKDRCGNNDVSERYVLKEDVVTKVDKVSRVKGASLFVRARRARGSTSDFSFHDRYKRRSRLKTHIILTLARDRDVDIEVNRRGFEKMKFFNVFVLIVLVLALVNVEAWKPFKKIEKAVRRVRDGVVKAGPAVAVVGQAATIAKG